MRPPLPRGPRPRPSLQAPAPGAPRPLRGQPARGPSLSPGRRLRCGRLVRPRRRRARAAAGSRTIHGASGRGGGLGPLSRPSGLRPGARGTMRLGCPPASLPPPLLLLLLAGAAHAVSTAPLCTRGPPSGPRGMGGRGREMPRSPTEVWEPLPQPPAPKTSLSRGFPPLNVKKNNNVCSKRRQLPGGPSALHSAPFLGLRP